MGVVESLIHASFVYERGNLIGKRILVIGDDDLFSLAAALTGLPSWVVVLEKDPRLVAFINHVARVEVSELRDIVESLVCVRMRV